MFAGIMSGLSALSQLGLGIWNQVQTDTNNYNMLKSADANLTFQKGVYDDQKKRYEEAKANQQAGFDALGGSYASLFDDKESDIPTMRV